MNNSPRLYITFLVVSVVLFLSCSDDNNPLKPITKMTIDNFPYEIGTVWQYQRDDRLNVKTDTLFVWIDDTTKITDDSLLVYQVVSEVSTPEIQDSADTSYWHIDGDTITYYVNNNGTYLVDKKIIMPLELGNNWTTGSYPPDSNDVLQIRQKTILGKSYSNAHQIVRTGGAFNDYVNDSYWLVPNIGLIQINENRISFGPLKDETWDLISFHEPDSFEVTDFPLQVHASWNYKVYNNLIDCAQFVDCYDTCTVTIMDSILDGVGIIRENWLFDYPNQERFRYLTIDQNKLYLQWHHSPIYFSLELPLKVGKMWSDFGFGFEITTVQVLGQQTITTEAGTFENAYYLKAQTSMFEEGATIYLWIAKGFGIVKLMHNSFITGSYEDKTWELRSYNPNNPVEPFTIDKFPSNDGMSRTYETIRYMSSIPSYPDTVIVQVAESSTVALWNYTKSNTTWQEFVSLEGTVAKFFYPDNLIEPFKSYQFPIELGNRWTTYPLNNNSAITSITPILVPAGRFFPCYAIKTDYSNNSAGILYEIEWVSPEIGLVEKTVVYAFPRSTETWKLIDYTN